VSPSCLRRPSQDQRVPPQLWKSGAARSRLIISAHHVYYPLPSIATRVHIAYVSEDPSQRVPRANVTPALDTRSGKALSGNGNGQRRSGGKRRGPPFTEPIAQEFASAHSGVIPRVVADIKTPCHFVLCVTKWPKQGSSRQMTWCNLTQRTPSNRNICGGPRPSLVST
jgi:hypothetical protein